MNPTTPPVAPGVADAAAGNGVFLGIILGLLLVIALGLAVMACLGAWRYRPLRRNVRFAGFSALAFYAFFALLTGFSLWTVLLFLLGFGLLIFGFAPKKWSDRVKEKVAKAKAARPQRPSPPPAE